MSEELFYERVRNISGVSLMGPFNILPTYGSSVSFKSDNLRFDSNDGYFKLLPNGINHLKAEFNLIFKVDEIGAQKLVNYYENSEGTNPIIIRTDPFIYRDITGYCKDYSINHVNNQNYQFAASLDVLESPGNLNWKNLNYLNYEIKPWEYNKSYERYDIVYAQVNDIELNNFFYCTEDHLSDATNSPIDNNSPWTQDFFWNPTIGETTSVAFENEKFGFGYSLYSKTKKNTALLPLNYKFNNISTKELKSILHFLENRGGHLRFKHQVPSVYNRPKIYYCDSWSHSFVYDDSHDLQVSFKEDPLGILPKKSTIYSKANFSTKTKVYNSDGNLIELPNPNPFTGNLPNSYCSQNNEASRLEIGYSCKNIGASAFRNCQNLIGELKIPYGLEIIGNSAFGGDDLNLAPNFTGDLIIPDTVTLVGDAAFRYGKYNGEIKLSKSLIEIETLSFSYLNNVVGDLVIPEGVTKIGVQAFRNMRLIDTITIPSTITYIGNAAFFMDNEGDNEDILIGEFKILAENPPELGGNLNQFTRLKTVDNLLFVPKDSVSKYINAGAPWTNYNIREVVN